ncbi:hypothetical protein W02_01180 [Nitrospira sp. KM1]|uniref:hypothetical protein n=1 Tax=Nitrospira sp. KM1 TaxID=1936990 RepID=UPI0013A77894|nr:hypothetical protein [Nitrospira sp. KM1]BCA52978.1 hypothetical protein W02_01180 [Nitrospira sp. KM1]
MSTNLLRPGLRLLPLLLSGCGLFAPIFGPVSQTTTSNVDQNKDEGYIRFTNISGHDEIFLDGASIGSGDAYRSGGQLGVTPGTHDVEIRQAGATRLKQKVYVGTGSTRTIDIR